MAGEDFRPTHVVPYDGLPAWEAPDVSRPTEPLDPLLPVRLLDRRGDWGRILCANGWSAWVDGRLLVPVGHSPPPSGQPLARTADPRPLLARAEEALGRYRQAVDELSNGRIDGETFRSRTRGLRVGAVVDGEGVWLYESEHERWVYGDGTRLATFAVPAGPVSAAADATGPVNAAADTPGPADASADAADPPTASTPAGTTPVPDSARPGVPPAAPPGGPTGPSRDGAPAGPVPPSPPTRVAAEPYEDGAPEPSVPTASPTAPPPTTSSPNAPPPTAPSPTAPPAADDGSGAYPPTRLGDR
ncbi:hypothetical protein [Streptomyces sp. NPDC020965]|uniref:hypothetical protein n=1 Tax=Streptomyces sp. NPDC020965 TaxID=3365105 RepID=UPI0037A36CA0